MVTSKDYIYIKMCDCPEIQELKPIPEELNMDDYVYVSHFYLPKHDSVQILKWDNDEGSPIIGEYYNNREGAIWLPHQGQLQDMVDLTSHIHNPNPADVIIMCHAEIRYNLLGEYYAKFTSMEQLWLAIVMKKKYNKMWTGSEWIIAKE